jgi:hypothetical protein
MEVVPTESNSLSKTPETICFNSKTRKFSYLSNSFPYVRHNTAGVDSIVVSYDERKFRSVEHAYQYAMFKYGVGDEAYACIIEKSSTAKNAKRKASTGEYVDYVIRKSDNWDDEDECSRTTTEESTSSKKKAWRETKGEEIMSQLIASKFNKSTNPELFQLLQGLHGSSLHAIGRASIWTRAGSDFLGPSTDIRLSSVVPYFKFFFFLSCVSMSFPYFFSF